MRTAWPWMWAGRPAPWLLAPQRLGELFFEIDLSGRGCDTASQPGVAACAH
ncbi:hypothetical protein U5640_05520 [Streptomyces sp. SS7]|uniref:hypothetical protein n=1 Tax=Streptomyces sp. SS7 TaxID=3108485 RepID=UPI0030EC2B78